MSDCTPSAVPHAPQCGRSALDPPPASVRDVKDRLRWRSERAARGLREWRSQGSRSVPREQGTLVPRSPTPVSGNGEHGRAGASELPLGDSADIADIAVTSTNVTECHTCGERLLLARQGRTQCERCRIADTGSAAS